MKNNLLFLTGLFLIFLSCSASNEDPTGWSQYNLTGKVKSIKVQEFSTVEKFGELVPDEISKYGDNYYVEFSEDGDVVKRINYNSRGDTTYYYNIEDHPFRKVKIKESQTEEKILYINSNNDTTVYYNTLDDGNIVEQKIIFKGLLQTVNKREYENSLLHKYYKYDKDGKLEFTSENIYDKKKLIAHIDCSYWSLTEDKISVFAYYLDEKGNIVKEEMSDSTRNKQSELQKITDYTYKYDDAGNWIKRIANIQDYFYFRGDVDINHEQTITTRKIEYY